MRPQIDQGQTTVRCDEGRGRGRDEHLSAMAGRGDSCGTVNVDPDISLLRQERRAGVDPDPHPNRAGLERLLPLPRCLERTRCGWEREEERVALRVDLDAVERGKRLAQHAPMVCE